MMGSSMMDRAKGIVRGPTETWGPKEGLEKLEKIPPQIFAMGDGRGHGDGTGMWYGDGWGKGEGDGQGEDYSNEMVHFVQDMPQDMEYQPIRMEEVSENYGSWGHGNGFASMEDQHSEDGQGKGYGACADDIAGGFGYGEGEDRGGIGVDYAPSRDAENATVTEEKLRRFMEHVKTERFYPFSNADGS